MSQPTDLSSIFRYLPGNYIILLPNAPKFTIVAFNELRAKETCTRDEHIGKEIFEAFPDNPDDPEANGVAMLTASLEIVLATKGPHTMAVQKYDILSADGGRYEERYWLPQNIPVHDDAGNVAYIIHSVQDVTARVRAQNSASIAKQNFEDFLNQAHIPFAVITGEQFLFTYANPAYTELMNNRQLVGKTVEEAIPELAGQPFIQLIRNVYDTGTPYNGIEVPATARYRGEEQPTTRYFNLTYTPYRQANDITRGVLAYAYDVTEQVALRRREETDKLNRQAYNLFMQAPVGICILKGPQHIVMLANKPALDIWGKDGSIIGLPILEVLPEIENQDFIKLLDGVRKTGKPFYANEHGISLNRNGEATTVYLNFVYQPYCEEDGSIDGVMAIAIDVTEQVLARRKIEHAEEAARLAINSANLGKYEINLVTDEIITSDRFNAIWGFECAAPRPAYAAALHKDDREIRLQAHRRSVETGKLHYEARVIWKDGTEHWIRVNGTVLYDVNGIPVRLLGVVQDITEQKAFSNEMARLVNERTSELQKANKQLETTNADLEQYAYITSHDLKEPIRKIHVFNDLLKTRGNLDPTLLHYTEKISAAATRMSGLINDLLEYSRVAHPTRQFTTVDLNAVLQLVLDDFELLISQTGAIINADALATITANPLQINQLFFNLVGNALKFSKAGVPPILTITGAKLPADRQAKEFPQLPADSEYYEIVFRDNGIGFDQEYADRIFMVFQRLNYQQEYAGHGIGLALCNKVVANHGGLIFAEGVVNGGATFTVLLPYEQICDPQPRPTELMESALDT